MRLKELTWHPPQKNKVLYTCLPCSQAFSALSQLMLSNKGFFLAYHPAFTKKNAMLIL